MKFYTPSPILAGTILLMVFAGCSKLSNTGSQKVSNTGTQSKYTNPNTAVAVCDYDIGDTALTNHGWTKTYDEEFNTDLSNWVVLQGGMIKESECYEPANVAVANGALQITAKQQSVSGPKTVGNDTTANFNFTSGWLYSKQQFVANSSAPKVRVVARIKMASGYGLTNLFWSFGNG